MNEFRLNTVTAVTDIAVVDLFCGVGGLTHGLRLAGLNVVAGIDIDESCEFPYEHNNRDVKFIKADVAEISEDAISECYKGYSFKVLVGCAPCQPFSSYTFRYRKNGHTSEKWELLDSFNDKVQIIKPHIVSMENVPELAKEKIFHRFIKSLENSGYKVSYSLVFCPDYGVPQNRKRLVLLASRLGQINMIKPELTPENYRTVKQTIGCLPEIKSGEQDERDPLHWSAQLNDTNLKRIRQSKQGGTWRDWSEDLRLPCHRKESGKTYASIYGRMSWDKPAPTITTQFYGYGNGRFGHPEQDRALSLREGAMLQSFPENYAFIEPGKTFNRHHVGTHIGNAVPVLLGKAIGKSITAHLTEVRDND
ncbi:MAG: DNA cytosine methyltransferase [Synergistaceae bacterium]|jgi:DNA (cytosine-5)-methyltransferase 1|nr:DNA cytosine methyltransferase [Synergistaceae bacterium]